MCRCFLYRSSFSEFASKYGKDERFKVVEKMRDREQMFADYLVELKKLGSKQQEEQHKPPTKGKTEKVRRVLVMTTDNACVCWSQVKLDFFAMLRESEQSFAEDTPWKKVKGQFDRDPRYKAVESSSRREEFFREHVKFSHQVCVV